MGPFRRSAVVFDRDGTLASVAYCAPGPGSGTAGWDSYNAALRFDAPVPEVAALFRSVRPDVARIITSGRAEGDHPGDRRRRFAMGDWLAKHDLVPDLLLMREGGDRRPDSVVKAEMYRERIAPDWDVLFVVDDRPQVVDTWAELGLDVLRVHDPGVVPPIAGDDPEAATAVRVAAQQRAGGRVPGPVWVRATVTRGGVARRGHLRRR